MSVIGSLALALVALPSLAPAAGGETHFTTSERSPAYPREHGVRYSFSVTNTTNRLMRDGDLVAYAPVRRTPTQQCLRIETSHPAVLGTDELGNQILYFRIGDLPPHGTRIISVRAELGLSAVPDRLEGTDERVFLSPEAFVQSEHPEIVAIAKQQAGGGAGATAARIARWVAENIAVTGYRRERLGALAALKQRKGDCTELMDLFVALCRASGIPARGITGFVVTGSGVLKAADYHNWAEYFADGAWQLADPSKGRATVDPSAYVALRVLGGPGAHAADEGSLFRSVGDGFHATMN